MAFIKASLLGLLFLAQTISAAPAYDLVNGTLVPRQVITPGLCITTTELVGNGSPRQWYLHKQLSSPLSCGAAPQCTVGQSMVQSFTISASIGGAFEWISGGLGVSKTWETGSAYECTGFKGDKVCVWQNIAHTEYTVRDVIHSNSPSGVDCPKGHQHTIRSPNTNNRGGGFYCVNGPCRTQGAEYWQKGT